MHLSLISCPQCGRPAQIFDRVVVEEPGGRVEQLQILCTTGHWLSVPAAEVEEDGEPVDEPQLRFAYGTEPT
jgi:hypothetical protein